MPNVTGFLGNQAMRGLSDATIKRRRWTLRTFIEEYGPLEAATLAQVESFLAARRAPATRRALLGDLRAFYRWGLARDILHGDPTAAIETPKVPKRLPTPIPTAELRRARDAAESWDLRAAIMLGAGAGLRVSEMAALRGVDIDQDRGTLTVRGGKGGKDRVVPLAPSLATMLYHCGPGRVLGRWNCGDSVSNAIRLHFRSLGIDHRAHDLRASFATELARVTGGDMTTVALLLGHESVNTTQRYVGLLPVAADVVGRMYGELAAA